MWLRRCPRRSISQKLFRRLRADLFVARELGPKLLGGGLQRLQSARKQGRKSRTSAGALHHAWSTRIWEKHRCSFVASKTSPRARGTSGAPRRLDRRVFGAVGPSFLGHVAYKGFVINQNQGGNCQEAENF